MALLERNSFMLPAEQKGLTVSYAVVAVHLIMTAGGKQIGFKRKINQTVKNKDLKCTIAELMI
jgi:hypothetical protein